MKTESVTLCSIVLSSKKKKKPLPKKGRTDAEGAVRRGLWLGSAPACAPRGLRRLAAVWYPTPAIAPGAYL